MKKSSKSSLLSADKLRNSTEILRAIAHPLRLEMLQYIDQFKSANVHQIYTALKLEQSIASQHLRILRQTGLVKTTREGKFIYYLVDYAKIEETTIAVGKFFKIAPTET
jgi:ArsR family transcriptional regulator